MVENFTNISEERFQDTLQSYIQIPVSCILKHLTVGVFMDTLKSSISKLHIKRSTRGLPRLCYFFSSVFRFLSQKTSVFRFGVHRRLRVSVLEHLIFGIREKHYWVFRFGIQ